MKLGRVILLSVVAFALGVEAAAEAPFAGEQDTARPGGVYISLTSADPAACASLCSADGICMAWTFTPDGACELKAVVTRPVTARGARSGLSARAPAFARRIDLALQPASMAPAPMQRAEQAPEAASYDVADALLGGPEPLAGAAILRPRLGDPAYR